MDGSLTVREDIVIPASEIWFTASRSGGPGGQHVNTTSSRVTLHFYLAASTALTEKQKALVMQRLANRISGQGLLQIDVDSERSQHRNREIAKERLVTLLCHALHKPKKRIPTKTPKRAQKRRLQEKNRQSLKKQLRSTPRSDD